MSQNAAIIANCNKNNKPTICKLLKLCTNNKRHDFIMTQNFLFIMTQNKIFDYDAESLWAFGALDLDMWTG